MSANSFRCLIIAIAHSSALAFSMRSTSTQAFSRAWSTSLYRSFPPTTNHRTSQLHRQLDYTAFKRQLPYSSSRSLKTSTSTTTLLSLSTPSKYGLDTATELPEFETKDDYIQYLTDASALPLGFSTGTAKGTFISEEAPSIGSLPIKATVIHLSEPTDSWAAVFTQNKFPGSPIKIGRARLSSGKPIQTLVINNKISNVCSGGDGVADAELVCEAVAKELNLPSGAESVLPSSTGIIGWRLPAKELAEEIVPKAVKSLQTETAINAANDIMTTDRYPKLRSKKFSSTIKHDD